MPISSAWNNKQPRNSCRLWLRLDKVVESSIRRIIGVSQHCGSTPLLNLSRREGGLGLPLYSISVPKAKEGLHNDFVKRGMQETVRQVFFSERERVKLTVKRFVNDGSFELAHLLDKSLVSVALRNRLWRKSGGGKELIKGKSIVNACQNDFESADLCRSPHSGGLKGKRLTAAIRLRLRDLPYNTNKAFSSVNPMCRVCKRERETIEHIVNDRVCNSEQKVAFWLKSHARLHKYVCSIKNWLQIDPGSYWAEELDCGIAKPDLICINTRRKSILVVDFCVAWELARGEMVLEQARKRKIAKYGSQELKAAIQRKCTEVVGESVTQWTYQVEGVAVGRQGYVTKGSQAALETIIRIMTPMRPIRVGESGRAIESRQRRRCASYDLRIVALDILSDTARYVLSHTGRGTQARRGLGTLITDHTHLESQAKRVRLDPSIADR